MERYIKSRNGFTLIEILVAGAVLAIIVIALGIALFSGRDFIDRGLERYEALTFAQQKMEELKAQGADNLKPTGTPPPSDSPEPDVTRTWVITDQSTTDPPLNLKAVSITVTSNRNRFHEVVIETVVTS